MKTQYMKLGTEIVMIDNDDRNPYAYCVVETTNNRAADAHGGPEIYSIEGRRFDCASMPLEDWSSCYGEANDFVEIDETMVDSAFAEAIKRTIAYASGGDLV